MFKQHLPERIEADLEFNYKNGAVYNYRAKNYIVFNDNTNPVIVKGLFRKRNRTWLEREFIKIAVKIRVRKGKEAMNKFVQCVARKIQNKTIKPRRIVECRTIAKSEKKVCEDLGIEPSTKQCFFKGLEKIGKRGKLYYKAVKNYEEYEPRFYIAKMEKIVKDYLSFV